MTPWKQKFGNSWQLNSKKASNGLFYWTLKMKIIPKDLPSILKAITDSESAILAEQLHLRKLQDSLIDTLKNNYSLDKLFGCKAVYHREKWANITEKQQFVINEQSILDYQHLFVGGIQKGSDINIQHDTEFFTESLNYVIFVSYEFDSEFDPSDFDESLSAQFLAVELPHSL